jgi:hypothetical protein
MSAADAAPSPATETTAASAHPNFRIITSPVRNNLFLKPSLSRHALQRDRQTRQKPLLAVLSWRELQFRNVRGPHLLRLHNFGSTSD